MKCEGDIMRETPSHWVLREPFKGHAIYTVWRTGATHSTRCGVFDLGDRGLARAIARCDELTAQCATEALRQ